MKVSSAFQSKDRVIPSSNLEQSNESLGWSIFFIKMNKITLAGCAIIKDSKILLLNRKKRNWYELPGGKIDESESAEEAAKRELKEELSCEVEIIRKIGTKDFEEDGYVMTYVWFLAKVKENQFPQVGEPDKFDHYKYISFAELNNHSLSPNMKNFCLELNNQSMSLD